MVSEENANADIAITTATTSAVMRAPTLAVLSAPLKSRPIGTNAARLNRIRAAALRWVWEYIGWNSLGGASSRPSSGARSSSPGRNANGHWFLGAG